MRFARVALLCLAAGCGSDPGMTPEEALKALPKPPIQTSRQLPEVVFPPANGKPVVLTTPLQVRSGERLELKGQVRVAPKNVFHPNAIHAQLQAKMPPGKRPLIVGSWELYAPPNPLVRDLYAFDGYSKIRLPPGEYEFVIVHSVNDQLLRGTLEVSP